eukprot:6229969-Amphidinium_carterae.1
MCGKIGNRARLWRQRFGSDAWSDVVPGYSFISKATQCASSLDRVFVRAPVAVVLELGATAKTLGAGKPPCQSDHFPVCLLWSVKK